MRIGIIGAGALSGALGKLFVGAGHDVCLGVRRASGASRLVREIGGGADCSPPRETILFAEIVLLAVPFAAIGKVLRDAGDALDGKVLIDATNPPDKTFSAFGGEGVENLGTASRCVSGAAAIACRFPAARVVKAFNALPVKILCAEAHRCQPENRLVVFHSQQDWCAGRLAADLIRDAGFAAVGIGELGKAARLEPGGDLYGRRVKLSEAWRMLFRLYS